MEERLEYTIPWRLENQLQVMRLTLSILIMIMIQSACFVIIS